MDAAPSGTAMIVLWKLSHQAGLPLTLMEEVTPEAQNAPACMHAERQMLCLRPKMHLHACRETDGGRVADHQGGQRGTRGSQGSGGHSGGTGVWGALGRHRGLGGSREAQGSGGHFSTASEVLHAKQGCRCAVGVIL